MSEFVLTDENYYSREADIHYMSCSQYQAFLKCEAAEIAALRGEFVPEKQSEALLLGQYFHSAFESPQAFEQFCQVHFDEIYKTKTTKSRGVEVTGKYAGYEKMDELIKTAVHDPVISKMLEWQGENERFMTGVIGEVPWRIKMDKYASGRRIIDYKTSANLHEQFYNVQTKTMESFIEKFGYMMRAAVYGEIERQNAKEDIFATFIIIALTKQDPPDREVFLLNDDARWQLELETVRSRLVHFQRLKEGAENPRRCGECEYCRKTKQIRRIKRYTDLMPEYRNDPDNVERDDYGGQNLLETLQKG